MIQYHFETFGGLVLDCYLDYDSGEKATADDSGSEPCAELVLAFVQGIDIKEVMDKFWIETIEREVCQNEAEG